MSILSVETRGLGVVDLVQALQDRPLVNHYVFNPSAGGSATSSGSSFFATWSVPLAAGAGGLALGVLLAVAAKKIKSRKRGG